MLSILLSFIFLFFSNWRWQFFSIRSSTVRRSKWIVWRHSNSKQQQQKQLEQQQQQPTHHKSNKTSKQHVELAMKHFNDSSNISLRLNFVAHGTLSTMMVVIVVVVVVGSTIWFFTTMKWSSTNTVQGTSCFINVSWLRKVWPIWLSPRRLDFHKLISITIFEDTMISFHLSARSQVGRWITHISVPHPPPPCNPNSPQRTWMRWKAYVQRHNHVVTCIGVNATVCPWRRNQ